MKIHIFIGLFLSSDKQERWVKMVSWTAILAGEMAFISSSYYIENMNGDSQSQTDTWTGYNHTDFLYTLHALGVGLGIALTLAALLTWNRKDHHKEARAVRTLGWVMVGAVLAGALGVTIYMSLELCFEQGGRWAISFLPLLLGEVAINQTVVALVQAIIQEWLNRDS